MRSIIEYIHSILESGHAIPTSQPIPAYITPLIYKEIEDKVHAWKSTVKMVPLGSIGKKKDEDFNGDIDIAIDLDDRDELLSMIKEVFPDSDVNAFTAPKIVSISYNWKKEGKEGIAQVDFMFTNNIDWAKWRFSSPDLKNGESKYKAAPKVYLIQHIVSSIPVKDTQTEYFDSGEVKKKWRYTFNQEGVFKYLANHVGKKGQYISTAKQEFREFAYNDPMNVMRFIFDTNNIDPKIFNSVESLWKAIHSDLWPWGEKALERVEKRFYMEYINDPKCEVPVKAEDFPCTYYKDDGSYGRVKD